MSATLGSTLRTGFQPVPETSYQYDARIASQLNELSARVRELRGTGRLSAAVLKRLRNYFKVKNIHHSNAIEGNLLDYGETRVVVEEGLTITGKPLKDTLEAKNLAHALNLFEELADREGEPIRGTDIRNIHRAILHGLDVENAGKYRTVNVEVSGSHYRPPGPESVPALMDEFCRWLEPLTTPSQREVGLDPLVVACAAHAWFVYIHPFVDGNGRTARILMNLVLIRYGYPIAIITKDDRQRYYDALEESQASDLTPFLSLIQECVLESLEEYQRAAEEQAITHEWARSVATKLGEAGLTRAQNEYEVWKSAMELFKGHCRETVQLVNEQASAHGLVRLFFKDFGTLEFEKYLSLRNGQSAKKTWFFRLDFKSGDRAARYLFFFGFPSYQMQGQVGSQTVTLHIAKETVPFFYERLDQITTTNNPLVWEIAYRQALQDFVARYGQRVAPTKIEPLVRNFVTEVAQRDF